MILDPRYCRLRFLIAHQLFDMSNIRACRHNIPPCFINSLATGLGRGGWGKERLPLLQADIPCNITDISCGAALFCSPHLVCTYLSLSQIGSHYFHCNTYVTSSVSYPHPFGGSDFGHTPLFSITILLEICFDVIILTHLCLVCGDLFCHQF